MAENCRLGVPLPPATIDLLRRTANGLGVDPMGLG